MMGKVAGGRLYEAGRLQARFPTNLAVARQYDAKARIKAERGFGPPEPLFPLTPVSVDKTGGFERVRREREGTSPDPRVDDATQ